MPVALGAASFIFMIVGLNFGFGVHTDESPILGAVITGVGWIIWGIGFLRTRLLTGRTKALMLLIALVPAALSVGGIVISVREGHRSPFFVYIVIEALVLVSLLTYFWRRTPSIKVSMR